MDLNSNLGGKGKSFLAAVTFPVIEERLVRNGTLYPSLAMCGMEIHHRKVFLTLGYLLITEKLMLAVELLSGKHRRSSFKGIWSLAVCPVQVS